MTHEANNSPENVLEDRYFYKSEFNPIEKLLFFSAGADQELLKRCPRYDQIKLMGIGGVVLTTAVLAFFVGSYAFSVVFRGQPWMWSVFFGLVWGLVIFNLDRFIVSVTGSGDGSEKISWGELGQAFPRLVIAIFIGFTLAKPIEIKLMESEINLELSKQQQTIKDEYFKKELDEHNVRVKDFESRRIEVLAEKKKIEDEIQAFQSRRDEADRDYRRELDGSGGTGTRGEGKIAAAKKVVLDRLNQELEKFRSDSQATLAKLDERIKEFDQEFSALTEQRDSLLEKAEGIADQHDGLMKRIALGHDLYPVASWVISLLFVSLELCPVLFKLMIPNSTYDFLKENQKRLALARAGIEIGSLTSSEGQAEPSKSLDLATYYPAKKVNQETSERAEVELKLTKQAQEKFYELVSVDIEKDPSKYVDLNLQSNSKS